MGYFEGHRVQQGGGDVLKQDALLGPVRDRPNRVADVAKARVVRRRHHGDVYVWGVTRRVWVRGGCWCGCCWFRIWRRCRDLREPLMFFLSPGENVMQNSIYLLERVHFNAFSTHARVAEWLRRHARKVPSSILGLNLVRGT